jgi:hypothetical protein
MVLTPNRWLMFALVAAMVGCDDEPIRVQRVPRPPSAAVRTLAVLIPREDATWFVKLSGSNADVAAEEGAFRKLVESLTFSAGELPIRWKTPDGWQDLGPTADRFTGFKTTSGIEATITQLGPNAKDVLANVNRWRGQIGLPPVDAEQLPSMTTPITVAGVQSTWVDLRNQGDLVTPLRRSTAAVVPSVPTTAPGLGKPKLNFTTPTGWQPIPASGMRAAAFRAGEGSDAVEVTVIPLSGAAGGLTANVNRWRGEVGLPESPPAQIQAEAKELTVDGQKAVYVDLLGPDGSNRQRTLGVILIKDDTTWFIKLRGPAEAVARQQAAFESFARSFQVGGGAP